MTRDRATQAALLPTPGRGGIWRTYLLVDSTAVNAAPWAHAVATGQLVGTCRECGGYLAPGKPYQVGRVAWYPAECVGATPAGTGCGAELATAGPRPRAKPPPRYRPA